MKMKLLLRDHVPSLGKRGEVVVVSAGYGQNYLLPKGVAVAATEANMKQIESERRKFEAVEQVRRKAAQTVADTIGQTSWTIESKANEEGHLFGSVTYKDLCELLASEKIVVNEKMLAFDDPEKVPIKERGIYDFKVHLDGDVVAESKLWVVEEVEE